MEPSGIGLRQAFHDWRSDVDPRRWWAGAAVATATLGLFAVLSPVLAALWLKWNTDPLRSVGMLLPPITLWLTLRAWRGLEWRPEDGSWWGLPLVLVAWIGVRYRLEWLGPLGLVSLLPEALALWLYVSGAVIMFAGLPAYRRAWFPIALLLLCKPVPEFFSRAVDYPLQAVGAATARQVAHWLGLGLDGKQLRLMFSPDLGMFIAPGCDGLRGATTLGLLALVIGHLRGLRPLPHGAFVAGGILLGYLFNLLRLSLLVLAYGLALHWPFLARHMEGADYAIGVTLFCGAVALFVPQRRAAQAHA